MARRKSLDRLVLSLRTNDGEVRRSAIERLGRYPFRSSRPTGAQRGQALDALLSAMRHDREEPVRREAAYVLGFWLGTRGTDARILASLLDVVEDERETARVRGQAAESASSYLSYGSGTPALRRRASALFLEHLRGPSAEIRFWCIYAIGQARMVEARPVLEEIARSDAGRVPYLWGVRDEAADVLLYFDSGRWPDRIPDCRGPRRLG